MTLGTSAAATPSVERRAAQVRKILESRSLQHADALKRLLDYLARHAMASQGDELKEYTVGLEAFGKPADYNPQLDSSVRVQAGKLRQKLDEYYRTDGAADDLIVSLPKGHFRLEFDERPPRAAAPALAAAAETLPSRVAWRSWAPPLTSAIVVILALGALLFLYPRAPRAAPASSAATVWTPEMEELWRPFLSSPRPLLVAIGTPLFVKIGGSFFRDPTLNTWENANGAAQVREVQRAVGGDTAGAFLYTGIGEAEGAFELGRLLLTRNRDITIRASSQLTWEDIDRYNVIFLGPPKYNQQTLDLPVRQDFEINHSQVQNLHPALGEPVAFDEKFSPDHVHLDEGHALISRLPGLHRTGEIMVLAGSYTESTRAAAEYVTRPEYVSALVHQMHRQGDAPQWFQLVVHVRYKSHTPIAIDPVALHAIQ
jgi:hypothetical protein